MAEIIPSIIPKNFEEVKEKIAIAEGLTNWVQLDIMDGKFVLPVSWQVAEDLENVDGKIKIEAHLMIEHPEEVLRGWMNYADRILIHPESTDYLSQIIDSFSNSSVRFGLALRLDTPLEVLEPYAGQFNLVQLMAINELGHHGENLDEKVYERIKILKEKYPGVTISIDGGVKMENADELIAAGAGNLIVGSAIWQSDDKTTTIREFQNLFKS